MPRKSFYLGCRGKDLYEIGRDPRFFEKGKGFAFKDFVCDVHPKHVLHIMGLMLGPGDIVKLKINTQKIGILTDKEREEIKTWKISRSQKSPR